MASETGGVDVVKVARELREQRVNMITNLLQYKLAHLVIMECMTGLQGVITCNDHIDKFLVKLTGPNELMLQMRYLKETAWQNRVLVDPEDLIQNFQVYPKKDKAMDIVPDASGAIQLPKYPASDDSSQYINAIKVDGYRCPERYIVTQQPMPNTLNDFWRLIVHKNIQAIISLNEINPKDKKSCFFWPTQKNPEMSPVDFIILRHSSTLDQEYFKKIVVHVLVVGNESQVMTVNILALKGWMPNISVPNDLHTFLKFHGFADTVSRQFPQTVVTCYDGSLASGVYVCTSYLTEKIKLEKCFDVCEAVKIMRRNRNQFVSEEAQLALLYEISATYIKGFQDYANFSIPAHTNLNIYEYIDL
ncbi:hypothetical protein HHI36_010894 [Cryptolaemus montrouzieri]|uniref:protein-tyrosine-phosphatase n=1 Tax=Cryptolaemus montrouzieri TaxID=559131 RepID=A0ABD2MK69_9CUCU